MDAYRYTPVFLSGHIKHQTIRMKKHNQFVSIGLPVFNGERYIEYALDSILAQTYPDFEVIISDNASTDRTGEICRDYQAQDLRISYYRNEKNLGAARNFNRVFHLSSGEYFKWAAHDDVMAPDFLMKCVEVLNRDPSVLLCYPRARVIDESGDIRGSLSTKASHLDSPKPQDRFGDLVIDDMNCFEIFGLIRAKVLEKTSLISGFIASDRVLRAELGLRGRFYEIPDYLFFSRDHPERSIRAMPAHHLRATWFDPDIAANRVFPHWKIFLEYARCVRRAPLSPYERRCCYLHLVRWLGVNLNWARMLSDLVIAFRPESWRLFFRLTGGEKGPKPTRSR